MAAGSLLVVTPGRPMGVWTRSTTSCCVPVGEQPGPEPRPLRRRADQADRPEVVEPHGGVDEGDVLGVVVGHHQHVGARRQLGEHELGQHRHRVDVHGGDGIGQRAQRLGVQVLGAGVDQVQVEVVAGQDAGELEADVADAEDRHARHDGQRLEQHGDLAAAALHAVLDRAALSERWLSNDSGRVPPDREQRPRTPYGLGLEVAATDRAPRTPRGDDHLGPGLARGVAADVGHRDEDAGLAVLRGATATACHHVVIPGLRTGRGRGPSRPPPASRGRRARRRRRAARTPHTPRAAPRGR